MYDQARNLNEEYREEDVATDTIASLFSGRLRLKKSLLSGGENYLHGLKKAPEEGELLVVILEKR